MVSVGIVGWRGMVGSVLMDRMKAENDFAGFTPAFFSTSQAGKTGPDIGTGPQAVLDAKDLGKLSFGLSAAHCTHPEFGSVTLETLCVRYVCRPRRSCEIPSRFAGRVAPLLSNHSG